MKSKEVLLLAVCLMAMAPVAQAQSTTPTADPQAQSFKGFYNFNKRVIIASAEKMPANNLTDATLKETYKEEGGERSKVSMITLNVYHGGEHYGNIVVYLRMKGITPPSSEPAPQRQQSQPKAETKPPRFDNEQYQ